MGDAPVPFSTRLFWDTTPDAIDWQAHGDYVISRVLQFGTVDELASCIRYYGWPRVERVALHKRGIPDDIRAFWAWYVSGSGEEPSQGHRAESARPDEELDEEDVASLLEEIVPAGRMPQAYVALYRWCRQRNIDVPQLLEIARAVVPWLNSQLILQCLVILDDGAEMPALGPVSKEWAEARRFFAAGVRRFLDQLCASE